MCLPCSPRLSYPNAQARAQRSTVSTPRRTSKTSLIQFLAIIALSVSIFLIIDLGRRAAANYRTQREATHLTQEVAAAEAYQAQLLAHRTYIASDLYVEEVARNELKWAKPGETVVVVLPTPENPLFANDTNADASYLPVPQSPAESWWLLFFGKSNPNPVIELEQP